MFYLFLVTRLVSFRAGTGSWLSDSDYSSSWELRGSQQNKTRAEIITRADPPSINQEKYQEDPMTSIVTYSFNVDRKLDVIE